MDRPDRPMMDAEVDFQHDVLPSSTRIKLLYYVLRQMIYANRPVDTKACDYLIDAHRPGSRVDTCHNLFDVDFIRYAILEGLAIVLADDLDMKDAADEIISRSKTPRMEETSTKKSSKRAAKKAAKKPTQKPTKTSTGATQCPEMLGLPVILACTTALYMNRMTLPERTFDHVMRTCKLLVKTTAERKEVRVELGLNPKIWKEYAEAFKHAVPQLEAQSFVSDDPAVANANGSSATLMGLNHGTLMKDLERLNDLVLIARNIVLYKPAQDLAGAYGFDQTILKLIDVCIRVTARGFDGDGGIRNEAQWGLVIQSYKTLLISSLQFIHNCVISNENRQFLLWLDLFASSRTADKYFTGTLDPRKDAAVLAAGGTGVLIKKCFDDIAGMISDEEYDEYEESEGSEGSEEVESSAVGSTKNTISDQPIMDKNETTSQIMNKADETADTAIMEGGDAELEEKIEKKLEDLHIMHSNGEASDSGQNVPFPERRPYGWMDLPKIHTGTIRVDEIMKRCEPQRAAKILQDAKDAMMFRHRQDVPDEVNARLHEVDGEGTDDPDKFGAPKTQEDDEVQGSDVAANGSLAAGEDGYDGSYRGPGDQERGLLTDIPLVLGPTEIDPLPLIIRDGIFRFPQKESEVEDENRERYGKDVKNMQSVRCNILLAQDAGRNLLRELLIFIAAWDLQDDDTYFKLMIQIMQAILDNGLMPFAYQAFGEEKDIVSPAQSMIIKILTQIFRGKQNPPDPNRGPIPAGLSSHPDSSSRMDIVVRNIFLTFRQAIIPETCALIYLQGQIRANAASPEAFPLNLWDMERVYEGVYQFLEFFAVLTESEEWKCRLVEWEIVSELVTLLRELDVSIPKPCTLAVPATAAKMEAATYTTAADGEKQTIIAPVAVERPYDQTPSDAAWRPDYVDRGASETPSAAIDNQEASEFEWRNLKKLVVLVLSSLVWKSSVVQNQIRQYGGVEMVLACCNIDDNNPYIREHAIMCLRFLLEGNKENQEIVRSLVPRKTVPDEVLDKRGYETYIDEEGKVGLRAKE